MEKYNGQKLNKTAIHQEIRQILDQNADIKVMEKATWKEAHQLAVNSKRMTVLCNILALSRGKPTSHMTTIWKRFGSYGMAAAFGDKEYQLTEEDIVNFVGEEWKKFLVEEVEPVEMVLAA